MEMSKFNWTKLVWQVVLGGVLLIGLGMAGCPVYNVWSAQKTGEAELAQASSNRMIKVQEAEAQREAASKLAEAEYERAKGVARAVKEIGASLKENEAYLRYLWLQSLATEKGKDVIYIPTEANLPILEAGRLGHSK